VKPLRDFMWRTTREDEVALLVKVSRQKAPKNKDDVELTTLIPAFVLSEIRAAFIIGFVIFIPFLIIDMVVSASLMSLGMMMLPPVTVAMPFKLLLFVLVNGWGLVITALVASYG
jgi:flagellar biosynthetic protein FliP